MTPGNDFQSVDSPSSDSQSVENFTAMLAGANAEASQGEKPQDTEMAAMAAALRAYRKESLHWAERRSAAQPSLAAVARGAERWATLPRWSLALIAVATITGGVAHLVVSRAALQESALASAVMPVEADSEATAADLAEDNRLLSSIDAALSYRADSVVEPLDLRGKRTTPPAATRAERN